MDSVARSTSKGLRWAVYVRISVDAGERGEDDYVSIETQEAGCRRLIADAGGTLEERHVYREVHTGIELFERPALSRLREAICRGELDAVATYQPKRLSRDPDHAAYLKTEAKHHGARYRYVLDDRGDSDAGELVSYIDHYVGKQEHKDILERTMRARVALVHTGRAWVGPRPPYGLRWTFKTLSRPDGRTVQKHDRWKEDPVTGPVLRRLFREALLGRSLREIAAGLGADGIPSARGGRWHPGVIRGILAQRVYTGEAASLRYVKDESQSYVDRRGHKAYRWVVKPESEWVKLPDGYAPALVDRETFEAVQQVLRGNKARSGRKMKHPEWTLMAGGRAKCAACGHSVSPKRRSGGGVPTLVCTYVQRRAQCPAPAIISTAKLDLAVKKLARAVYEHPEIIKEQADQHRRNDPAAADLEMVERTLAEITRKQQSLAMVAARLEDPEAAAPLALQLQALADQKRKAQAERRELLERRAGWGHAQALLDEFAATCHQVSQRLDGFSHADWQQAVDALGITATVWKVGTNPDQFRLRMALTGLLPDRLIVMLGEGGEKLSLSC